MEAKLKQIVPQNIDEANLLSDLTSEAVFLKQRQKISKLTTMHNVIVIATNNGDHEIQAVSLLHQKRSRAEMLGLTEMLISTIFKIHYQLTDDEILSLISAFSAKTLTEKGTETEMETIH